MKICNKPSEIRGAVRRVKPSHIAVAFLGADWREYVKADLLQEVVASTMLGSNPRAIEELMNELGHENVHFLDNLHAKIYLGDETAFLGSANLSKNGFSDSGHLELGVELTDEDSVQKIRNTFRSYVRQARELYPTKASKKKKLANMYARWQKAVSAGLSSGLDTSPPTLSKSRLSSLDHIHIAWYIEEGGEYNQETIYEEIPETSGQSLDSFFTDSTCFLEEDDVQEGQWILLWRCNASDSGLPRKKGDIRWIYIDKVIPGGIRGDEPYTKLAAQTRKSHRETEPFILNSETKQAIRAVLSRDQFSLMRKDGDDDWSADKTASLRGAFFKAVVTELSKKEKISS